VGDADDADDDVGVGADDEGVVERIGVGEEFFREGPVDDGDLGGVGAVGVGEGAAGGEGDADGGEVVGADVGDGGEGALAG
jgi:hypothetical protein